MISNLNSPNQQSKHALCKILQVNKHLNPMKLCSMFAQTKEFAVLKPQTKRLNRFEDRLLKQDSRDK